MPTELTNLNDVSPATVEQLRVELTAVLQERYPQMDLKRGVLQDLLLRPHAVLTGRDQDNIRRYLDSRSLLQVSRNPTLAAEELVDHLLSNFRLERLSGSQASGEVTIIASSDTTITIPRGLTFTANGQSFVTDRVYTAKASAAQITTANDRLFRGLTDGTFSFTVEVTAVTVGAEGLVRRDTLMIPETRPKNFVSAFAAGDFIGGEVPETNSELLERLQEGLAAKAPSNRVTMQAMLRNLPGFEGVLWTSIIGMTDPEMTRDQHTIFPVSSGGVVDWYVRAQERLLHRTLPVEARYEGLNDEGIGRWSFSFDRDVAAGFYEIRDVRLPTATNVLGSFEFETVEWATDLTGEDFVPDIVTPAEAAFSRYQTVVVRFLDAVTDHSVLSVGDIREYDVGVVLTPLIADIQDTLSSYELQAHGSDVLIRAAVPCFLQLSFTIEQQNVSLPPNLDEIKNALAREVNRTPFIGRIFASTLHDVAHGFLDGSSSLGNISMFGRILTPDRGEICLQSTSVIEVPQGEHPQVSEKTVQFYLDPQDISITTRSSIPVPA